MADGEQWCLIESDPGLLTDLIGKIGVKGVQVMSVLSIARGGVGVRCITASAQLG